MYALVCTRTVLREAEARHLKPVELGPLETDGAFVDTAAQKSAIVDAEHAIESLTAFNNQGRRL
jgi:hypothetical protein